MEIYRKHGKTMDQQIWYWGAFTMVWIAKLIFPLPFPKKVRPSLKYDINHGLVQEGINNIQELEEPKLYLYNAFNSKFNKTSYLDYSAS